MAICKSFKSCDATVTRWRRKLCYCKDDRAMCAI